MSQDIDFLPLSYHQQRENRTNRLWRLAIVGVFLGLIGAGTFFQQQKHARLRSQRDALQSRLDRLTDALTDEEPLRRELDRLETRAQLLTQLRLQIPPTRLLNAVTGPLPPRVTLTEFHVSTQPVAGSGRRPSRQASTESKKGKNNKKEKTGPIQRDLQRLRGEARSTRRVVVLSGLAHDEVAITHYLAALESAGNFRQIKLVATRPFALRDHRLRRFEIRLQLRQPSLSTGAESANAKQAEASTPRRPT